jgi:hypothetical protein
MKLCNVSDLSDITITDFFDSGNSTFIAHNLIMRDQYIFVSHYFDGLQIFDWSDPENVRRVAWYDTSTGEDICCRGAWGVYPLLPSGRILISDRQRGLFVFEMFGENAGDFSIEVTPNPSSDYAEVNLMELGFYWNQAEVQVHSADGRLVHSTSITNPGDYAHWVRLDVRDWSAGMYVVTVRQGEQVAQARFVHSPR